ncbi:LysM peptidoglycan-binding domain-containing protein [Deefgea salmonis]|uniref:LysM peptidoglycan-binding domain-containing protein n=1 Tax=Deefgea salmonis TaxID=2875502 RepID=A0ABS8BN95_9NEIS|nr:LysM peptidoglycan-binding domain-containing protein [Deefgea salmonis]MCB5197077.1 LysM peptidoglycan-binding domain-containing protein [Deefgea salmonis]
MLLRLPALILSAFLATPLLAADPNTRFDYALTQPTAPISADTQRVMQALFSHQVIAPAEADIWARVRKGFAIPDIDSPLVSKWENYYASRPDYLNRIISRSTPYLYFVVEEVEKRGMPMEMALLPMIESAYNPKALSSAQAAGMWQFIPATGKRYGLERTWWYDGRRDVVAATGAALSYLQEIHGLFDDWQLALASYNWGENAVRRAVDRNQAAGLSAGYSDLRMPDETRNYVPKLLAIRNIIADPAAYGVELKPMANQAYFTTLQPGKHMDVSIAAQLAEISVDELLRLNPGFIRPVIAHKDDRQLVLPIANKAIFERNLAQYTEPLLNWQPYVTKTGERFEDLATTFGIAAAELRDMNDIASKENMARGQTILVPRLAGLDISERQTLAALHKNRESDTIDTGANDQPKAQPVLAKNSKTTEHKVGKGDTLFNIANRYGLSLAQLKSLNGQNTNHIAIGDTLLVQRQQNTLATKSPSKYVAQRGDTYSSIARKFDVELADLKKWNRQNLVPGMKVVLSQASR